MRLHAALFLGLCLAAGSARAGMFDDDEARRDIAALRAQVGGSQQAIDERLAKIESMLQDRAIETAWSLQ